MYVDYYINGKGLRNYKKVGDLKKLYPGSTIVKPSFTIGDDGKAVLGPLVIIEKMRRGFNAATADWRYAKILPGGELVGLTGGKNADSLDGGDGSHPLYVPANLQN